MARGTTVEAGKQVPEFTFVPAEGAPLGHKDLAGGVPLLLAFFKASCPTCQLTLPFLERLHHQGAGQVRVVAVSQDDAETTREFQEYFQITYPAVFDRAEDGYPASNAFGITHVPSMFLLEPDGRVSWAENGFRRDSLAALARRFGATLFEAADDVPDWRPG